MKKLFIIIGIILIFLLTFLMVVLSTIGFETDKFNKLISDKAIENNKNISLTLDKIKFKLDIKGFNLFLETESPELIYKDLLIPIQNVKVYLDFSSLIKSKTKISKIYIFSKEVNIDQLKKIIIKTKPSNLNSYIINKVQNAKLVTNVELYLNDNFEINNFIARGEVKKLNSIINNELSLKNTSFNFFADTSDILIKNIKSEMDGFLIKEGNLQISRNEKIELKSDFSTEIKINKNNIINYLPITKKIKFINQDTNFYANLDNFLDISFDKTFKIISYNYTNKGKINKSSFRFKKSLKNSFLQKNVNQFYLKDSKINTRYASDNKNYIHISGAYSIDNQKYQNYDFKNDFLKETSNIYLDFKFSEKLNFNLINYEKEDGKDAKIFLNVQTKKDFLNLKELKYVENKNLILIEKLKINKQNLISLKKIQVKTFDENNLKNDFLLDFGKKIKISGSRYDATNINKLLNQKSRNNILKKISKEIEINLKNIDTPLSTKLMNFRLIGVMQKGKLVKISSKGDFGDNKFLDISMKNDKKNKKQYLEVYSDLPQPLLSEYTFFKGLSGGILTFSSIIEDKKSTSKLIIDNFKLVNAPGVVKLLSLADFSGLADLAEGEGLSFDKMEIQINNNNGFVKLNELYAIGPSISVLMEGYKEESGLTSLRGTLVPAKNLNKLLSKIPVIGKIIIPKEIGEGLFGVSFKIKGTPGKMKTSINPIKTLTPRFITKALEKQKKSK